MQYENLFSRSTPWAGVWGGTRLSLITLSKCKTLAVISTPVMLIVIVGCGSLTRRLWARGIAGRTMSLHGISLVACIISWKKHMRPTTLASIPGLRDCRMLCACCRGNWRPLRLAS